MTAQMIAQIAVSIVLVLGAWLIWIGWRMLKAAKRAQQLYDQFDARGVPVQAIVANKRAQTYARGGGDYTIQYRYDIAGPDGANDLRVQDIRVTPQSYARLKVGDRLNIRYLPENPDTVRIEDSAIPDVHSPAHLRRVSRLTFGVGVILLVLVIPFDSLASSAARQFEAANATPIASTGSAQMNTSTPGH